MAPPPSGDYSINVVARDVVGGTASRAVVIRLNSNPDAPTSLQVNTNDATSGLASGDPSPVAQVIDDNLADQNLKFTYRHADPDGDAAEQCRLGHGLDQFDQPGPGNQARQALEWVETAQIRLQRFQGKIPAAEEKRRQQRGCQQGKKQGDKDFQGRDREVGELRQHPLRLVCQREIDRQTVTHQHRDPADHPRSEQRKRDRSDQQNEKCAYLARTGHLPFFARLFQASCRCRFSSFEIAFLSHSELSLQSA
jgi:hypothetical protein